jgi:DNA-directed RNA polymerase alpha subunit
LRNRQKNKEEDEEIDMILIDNDFRVIDSVVYNVEEVIDDVSGSVKDKLVLTIKSQFSAYAPQKFMAFAGEVLSSYAKLFVLDDIYIDRSVLATYSDFQHEDRMSFDGEHHNDSIKSTPIDALPLSERTRNALIKNGILYVEDLEKKKKGELLIMKGV